MEFLTEFLISIFGKAIAFLPISYAVRYFIEKALGFAANFKSTYLGLLLGNIVASTVFPILFWFGLLVPHNNDPSAIFFQMIVLYSIHFAAQTTLLGLLCKDSKGNRISFWHAAFVVLILTALSVGVTTFYWITAR